MKKKILGFEVSVRRSRVDTNSYSAYSNQAKTQRHFYNIGAGSFYHPYWTNIDYHSKHYSAIQKTPFINHDLTEKKPLPIADETAELIYCSHTIEHLDDSTVYHMLTEAHRALKQGGGVRLTTPDAELEYFAYRRRDRSFWYWALSHSLPGRWEHLYTIPMNQMSLEQLFLDHFASQLCEVSVDESALKKYSDDEIKKILDEKSMEEALDFFTHQCSFNKDYPGNHINWWSYNKIIEMLRAAGFIECYRSAYGQSHFEPLRNTTLFDNTHPRISLYVEAIK